ncbi:phospho-N-acetylmuramoyl-pentapeptide-transferase [Arthrobacter livingstonensis]|uniref:Phospho-N-acetylmuramoyl-pentapeptide-transferase n=1 Tax=Arthrobacter livingstonensis TaxID=670078 RepID=A0A2V5LXK3_9MICC|nr:phospho-N-acetylmuramoyl-pentapeptide-transferase [Arthrobacter livingstonensis]PYI67076.1 phospho-N-acetylmuramoyl-pentapeptide-transferase [Arthrobacter livingstonensis]
MIALLIGTGLALAFAMVGTPLFIRLLVKKGYGQIIRDDGPTTHQIKRGTPTMGGTVVVGSVVGAYFLTHLIIWLINPAVEGPTASGLLMIFLMVGQGLVGFLDDFLKISNQRSLGLDAKGKLAGQAVIGIAFAIMALGFPDSSGRTPASTFISFARDIPSLNLAFAGAGLGVVLFVIWSNLIIAGTTNGVNLTDGLDGLATGAAILVFGAYTLIGVWQNSQVCGSRKIPSESVCYEVRDPLDLSLIAVIMFAALIGFLWWNTSPAKIFMGDTGSLAIGGAIAGFAILSRTEILLFIIGGLFVLITLSVIIQVGFFKLSKGRRVFRMAPLQHHFELKGWPEVTVVVRFWILAGLMVAVGLGAFYAEWVVRL